MKEGLMSMKKGSDRFGLCRGVLVVLLLMLVCTCGATQAQDTATLEKEGEDGGSYLFGILQQRHVTKTSSAAPPPPDNKNNTITCRKTGADSVECDGVTYTTEETDSAPSEQFFIDLSVSIGLTLFAGLMSGLTMGLMSIDLMNLQILINGGTPSQKRYAKRILPLVKRHHLVLVTMLIWDAAAVEALPLFLDRLVGTIIAIVISVTCIVLFGEIIPQAVCTRFGLAIGGHMFWFVWILIILIFPIAWPISKLLDFMLGGSHGTFFRRAELKELVHLHKGGHTQGNIQSVHQDKGGNGNGGGAEGGYDEEYGYGEGYDGLSADEVTIIHGALDMKLKTVRDAMTPIEQVFMLEVTDTMGERTMDRLLQEGYSRVPIYRKSRQNILGMLLVKTLIKLNPADEVSIMDLELRRLPVVNADMPLYEMLNLFQRGHSHMAVVVEPIDHITVLGIITMEDVIEELIQEEIVDETDLTAIHQPTLGIGSVPHGSFLTGSFIRGKEGGGGGGGVAGPIVPQQAPNAFVLRSSRSNVPTRVAMRPDRIRSERLLREALVRGQHPPGVGQPAGQHVQPPAGALTPQDPGKEKSTSGVPIRSNRRRERGHREGEEGSSFIPRSPSIPITTSRGNLRKEAEKEDPDSVKMGSFVSPPNIPNIPETTHTTNTTTTTTPIPTITSTTSAGGYTQIPDPAAGGGGGGAGGGSAWMNQSSHVIPVRERTPLLRDKKTQD